MLRYCVAIVLIVQTCFVAQGQIPLSALNEAPSRQYLNITLPSFYYGNFNDTLNHLNNDLRNAAGISIRNQGTILWLDSICYYALQGECHFQMARYDEAFRAFNTALQIYFEQSDWLMSIEVAGQPGLVPRTPLAWGASIRPGSVGNFNTCRFQMSHGHLKIVPVGDQRGLMEQRALAMIQADHII